MGEFDASLGELGASLGEFDVSSGEFDASLGEFDACLGELDAKLGEFNAKLGEFQAGSYIHTHAFLFPCRDLRIFANDLKETIRTYIDPESFCLCQFAPKVAKVRSYFDHPRHPLQDPLYQWYSGSWRGCRG